MAYQPVATFLEKAEAAVGQGNFELAAVHYDAAARELLKLTLEGQDASQSGEYSRQASQYFALANEMRQRMNMSEPQPTQQVQTQAQAPAQAQAQVNPTQQVQAQAQVYPQQGQPKQSEFVKAELPQEEFHGGGVSEGPEFSDKEIKNGAMLMGGAAGTVAGSFIGIPILGGVAGAAYARLVLDKDTCSGERARSWGKYGAKLIRKAKNWNNENKVTERIEKASKAAYDEWNKPAAK